MFRSSLAFLVLTLACGDGLAPPVNPADFTLEFTVSSSMCSQDLFETFDRHTLGSLGVIEITDIYGAPNGGYQLSPSVDVAGAGRLIVTIEGETIGPSITVPICHPYELAIGEVPRGRYELILRHSDRVFSSVDTVRVSHVTVT